MPLIHTIRKVCGKYMSCRERKLFKKGDLIVITAVAALALLLLFCNRFFYGEVKNGVVEITVDGKLYGSYSLQETKKLVIEDTDGGSNTVLIENGSVCVFDADCPDRLCVKQGRIHRNGQSVVCLPHGLVITVKDAPSADVDMTV